MGDTGATGQQGEPGTTDHTELENRDAANQHPMSAITGLVDALSGKYARPAGGIPAADMSVSVQNALSLALSALQQVPATYRTSAQRDIIDAQNSFRNNKIFGYGGDDLLEKYTLAELSTKISAQDFSGIDLGDYIQLTLNGTFRDYGSYTVPAGTTYYRDAACTVEAGVYPSAKEACYQSETAVMIRAGEYAKMDNTILPYFEKSFNNAIVKMEVAGINQYVRCQSYRDVMPPHLMMLSRDSLPAYFRMRKGNTIWEDTSVMNPWHGCALFRTFNDPDYGIINLLKNDPIFSHIYGGSTGDGIRFYWDTWASVTASEPNSSTLVERGKLFLPTERELYGSPMWQPSGYHAGVSSIQLPLMQGMQHVIKAVGNVGRSGSYWLASASSSTDFVYCSDAGDAYYCGAAETSNPAPLGFLLI